MSKEKKALQLGMNPSTASHRLVKDILWYYVQDRDCHQCGKKMTRETFSIEHIIPWLDSGDPIYYFFSIGNVTFSHQTCNSGAARSARKNYESPEETHRSKLDLQNTKRAEMPTEEKQAIRREQYLRTGN